MGKLKLDKIVPDTSVLIDGVLSKMIESGELEVNEIIIHNASMDELIQQAAKGRETGFIGLEEVKRLQKLAKEKGFRVRFAGRVPTLEEIKLAKSGRIDSMIRDLAIEEDAVLITSDRVQALAAEAYGCKVYYIEKIKTKEKLTFEQWFDENTASLHIKENVPIMRKKGKPGEWYLEFLDVKLDAKQIENIALEILEAAKIRPDGFIEIERPGSIIVQLGKYRIVIVKPPVSDGWEITIVRPLKKLKLEDYNISEKLLKRLEEKAEGILIAGAPGHGKCLLGSEYIFVNGYPIMLKDLKRAIVKNGKQVMLQKIKVLSFDSKIKEREIKDINWRKEKSYLIIRTASGRTIKLTENHPILALKEDLGWYDAGKLNVGDYIAVVKRLEVSERGDFFIEWVHKLLTFKRADKLFFILKDGNKISLGKAYKLLKEGKLSKEQIEFFVYEWKDPLKIKIPKELTPELCEILGYLWSEGLSGKYGISNNDERIIERFIELSERIFGIPKEEFKRYGNVIVLNKDASILVFLHKVFGYPLKKKHSRLKIPKYLFTAPKECIAAFIRAFFDGDGSASNSIEFVSSSEKLIRDLATLLLRFGILGRIYKKKVNGKEYYRLIIYHIKDIEIFVKEIGSLIKKDELLKLINKKKDKARGYSIKVNELIREFLRNFAIKYKIKRTITIDKLKELYNEALEKYIEINKRYNLLKVYSPPELKKILEFIENVERKRIWEREKESPRLTTIIKYTKLPIGISREEFIKTIKFLKETFRLSYSEIDKILNLPKGKISRFLKGEDIYYEDFRNAYENLLTYLSDFINKLENLLAKINIILNENIYWDKIVEIRRVNREVVVYDIEVNGIHNYLAGNPPIIVHNSTFAQALAEWYASKGKIVKTVESPRDLQVEDIITQYSKNFATSQEIHDILLLARPDYVVFDEMRDTPDFKLYVDLRLAGVGMIGVVHATEPIEAIQRFLGRIDVGMIPQVVDTIIFIRKGRIEKVYELKLVVKVPTGMTAEDLARPVVEVRDFETGELEYEIYVFGEETMIVPVKEVRIQKTPALKLLEKLLIEKFRKFLHTRKVKVEVVSPNRIIVWVPEEIRPRLIGRKGKTIEALEKAFGIKITVKTFEEEYTGEVEFEIEETKNVLIIKLPEELEGRTVNIYVDDKLLFTATVGKKGKIRLSKRISIAQELLKALREGRNVKIVVT